MPKAYSYTRFSTPEQEKGDSHRRQTAAAREYADRKGLDLDDRLTFHDLGVSAFRGANAETGRLAEFRHAVDVGLVPKGSVLLVESLDRISRQAARMALRVLEDIVDRGVSVVTLNDGREYDRAGLNNDPMALMVALLIFIRANEESETKSRRLRASWAAKRAKADQKPLTSRGPAWLRLAEDRASWIVLEERAAVVRAIFNMAARGVGEHAIVATLNRDAVPTWGDNGRDPATMWRRSYVQKILHAPAVVGTLAPFTVQHEDGRKVRKAERPVESYYPQIIEPAQFRAVQALKATASPARGRHAARPVANVLGGIARCSSCGAPMTRVSKGTAVKAGIPKLVCTRAKTGAGCAYRPTPLDAVERALVVNVDIIVGQGPAAGASSDLAAQLAEAKVRLARAEAMTSGLIAKGDEIDGDRFWALLDEANKLEAGLRKRVEDVMGEFNALHGPLLRPRVEALRAALAPAGDLDRAAVNVALRQLFDKATVDPEAGSIALAWKSGGVSRVAFDVETVAERAARRAAVARRAPNGEFATAAE